MSISQIITYGSWNNLHCNAREEGTLIACSYDKETYGKEDIENPLTP